MAAEHDPAPTRRHRPRAATVFIAAFVAGAAAAVGINRVLDVHLAQSKPQVECEPIFVALRSLPQGVPVTVWDVALRDWPKAMMPTAAVRVNDTFAGCLLKHPLREGQPLLTVQLLPPASPPVQPAGEDDGETVEEMFVPPVPATVAAPPPATATLVTTTVPAVTTGAETKTDVATVDTRGDQTGTTGTEPERTESEHVAAVETVVDDPVEAIIETAAAPTAEPEIVATVTEPTIEPTTVASVAEAEAGTADPTTVATAGVPDEAQPQPRSAEPQSAEPESQPVLPTEQLVTAPPATDPPSPPVAETVVAAAPQPSLARIRQEPTPAAEPPMVPVATAPAPTAIGPHLLGQPAVGSQGVGRAAAMDLPSRPAADVASMPSVIARGEDSAAVSAAETADSSARYLVVPERIAQQADTSFTTPAAPATPTVTRATPDAPPGPAQPPTAARQPGPRPAAGRQAGTQPGANRGPSRTANGRNPAATKQPQAAQPKPTERAAAESSSWGSMFPNVSAGIEAIGKWRTRGREAVADESRDPQPRR